eukprot:scaffold34753_cov157-Isochrysis_galbana.AAC.1
MEAGASHRCDQCACGCPSALIQFIRQAMGPHYPLLVQLWSNLPMVHRKPVLGPNASGTPRLKIDHPAHPRPY